MINIERVTRGHWLMGTRAEWAADYQKLKNKLEHV